MTIIKGNKYIANRVIFVTCLSFLSLYLSSCFHDPTISPDGRFQARLTESSDYTNSAYEVIEIGTGKTILITHSQYPDMPNDVKAEVFSADSKMFAVAYHYSHAGNYTWVGIWSTETGEFLYGERIEKWTTNIDEVFDN